MSLDFSNFEPIWQDSTTDELCADILRGHPHVAVVVGSAASYGRPSGCLGVTEVKMQVLQALLHWTTGDTVAANKGRELLREMCEPGSYLNRELVALPFEQFMGCLDVVSEAVASKVIHGACGSGAANANHESIATVAVRLLQEGLADTVSVITTNYDLCLESALSTALGEVRFQASLLHGVPCHEAQLSQAKCLRYAKVHGSIARRDSLVFSFSQMFRLLLSRGWESELTEWVCGQQGQRPTLALFAGYGFWDPDLRGWLEEFLGGARIYRNEFPEFREREPASGTEHLQRAFFDGLLRRGCALRLLRSGLDSRSGEEENVLGSLRHRLTGKGATPPEAMPCPRSLLLGGEELPWGTGDTSLFLGRLCHELAFSEGSDLYLDQLVTESPGLRQVDLAHSYLRTFGNASDWLGGARAARRLRDRRLGSSVGLLSWGYESFMRTLVPAKSTRKLWTQALQSLWCLTRGHLIRRRACESARVAFKHYSSHFCAKAIQTVWQLADRFPLRNSVQSLLRLIARRQAVSLQDLLSFSGEVKDLDLYGDIAALLCELSILAGDKVGALEAARQSRVLRTVIGRASNAIQGDRLLGWALLAQGKSGRDEASEAFLRGFILSLPAEHPQDVRRKMGANLLRVWVSSAPETFRRLTGREHQTDALSRAYRALMSNGTDGDASEARKTVAEHVLHTFSPREQDLLAELVKYSDLQRYPIYLPLCEPPTGT